MRTAVLKQVRHARRIVRVRKKLTGTAERPNQADQSWYICYAPDPQRPIVIAVTIEEGGFGAEAAAPAARLMMSQWFGVQKKFVSGTSRTR